MIKTEDSVFSPSPADLREPSLVYPAMLHPDAGPGADTAELVIRPRIGWINLDWQEMWSHRELLMFFIWRDITVRYKQTVLGPAWAILQPLIMLTIFTVIFGRFAGIDFAGFPYPVAVFAGLIPWMLFSQGMPQAALSLLNQQQMLSKVYFPRLFVPIAAASVFVVDLLMSLGIYAIVLLYYQVAPSWGCLWLLLLVPLTLVATLGMGVALAALTVSYRDFKHIIPFLVQILMYVTPVMYPSKLVGPRLQLVLAFNPMFGIVTAYRSAILGMEWNFPTLIISTATALGSFVFAIFYFRKVERHFADVA